MRNIFGSCMTCFGPLVLAVATGLFAQSAGTNSALMLAQPVSQNCPVSLNANRLPGGSISRSADADRRGAKPLEITFLPGQLQGIAGADLILHGTYGTHVVPAANHEGSSATETFSVTPQKGAGHHFESVVYLRRLTAVDYLEVRSITFADGTVWHASATSTCRVAPDGFMLVASAR